MCLFPLHRIGKDFEDDLEFLLQGVSGFELQNGLIASEVFIHGPLAFPIGTTEDGRAFLAGAYYGQGRVVVITHEGLLGREVGSEFVHVFFLMNRNMGVTEWFEEHENESFAKAFKVHLWEILG